MQIALLAPPGVQSLDVVGPAEIFWEAGRRLGNPSAYEVRIIGSRRKRRNRSRPCPGRRRLWTGSRADCCALHGRIPEKAWRAVTIQYTPGRANVEAHTYPARTGICAAESFIPSFGGGNGKASMHEHAQLFPFVPP